MGVSGPWWAAACTQLTSSDAAAVGTVAQTCACLLGRQCHVRGMRRHWSTPPLPPQELQEWATHAVATKGHDALDVVSVLILVSG